MDEFDDFEIFSGIVKRLHDKAFPFILFFVCGFLQDAEQIEGSPKMLELKAIIGKDLVPSSFPPQKT